MIIRYRREMLISYRMRSSSNILIRIEGEVVGERLKVRVRAKITIIILIIKIVEKLEIARTKRKGKRISFIQG